MQSLSKLSISFDARNHHTRAQNPTANLISKLKPETLGYIISLASRGDNKHCRKDSTHGNTSRQLVGDDARRTSQVSRQWREAALANKHIWLGPVLFSSWYSSLQWTETVLARSHPLPLDLIVPSDIKREKYPHIIALIRKEHRIRNLEFNLNPIPIPDFSIFEAKHPPGRIVPRERLPLYVVDNLDLDSVITRSQSNLRETPIPNPPPKKLCFTKALRNLTFGQECFIHTVLLLDGLRSLECLETLRIHHLHDDFPSSAIKPPSPPPEIPALKMFHLNLKELSVKASTSTCASILKNISLPASCSIRVECYDATVGAYLDDVLLKMKQAVSSWRCETDTESNGRQFLCMGATHIGFSIEGPQDNGAHSSTESNSDSDNHPYLGLSLHCRRSSSQSQSPSQNLIYSLLPLLLSVFQTSHNLPTVLTVDVDHSLAITRAVRNPILDWLIKTPTIQTLEFITYDAFVLLEPLFRLRNRSRAVTNKVLPTLCDLTFYDITQYTPHPYPNRSWRRLARGLARRHRARSPVQHIEFVNCYTRVLDRDTVSETLNMIKTISPFVEEIYVDGEEFDFDSTTAETPGDGDPEDDLTGYDTDSTVHQDSDIEL